MAYEQITPDTIVGGWTNENNSIDDNDSTFASTTTNPIVATIQANSVTARSDTSRYWAGMRVVWELVSVSDADATNVGFTLTSGAKVYTLASESGDPTPGLGVKNTDIVMLDNDDTNRVTVDNAIAITVAASKPAGTADMRLYEVDFIALPRFEQTILEG